MQPSPYDRSVAFLRAGLRRSPVAFAAVLLACAWILLNVYETAAHWDRYPFGWFDALEQTVTLCATGIVVLAALVWLVERAFGDSPR
jgi:hypothetical protein